MAFADSPPRYQSYLLRCWQERTQSAESECVWRFSLEESQTGRRHGFATIDAMVAFLQAELQDKSASVEIVE